MPKRNKLKKMTFEGEWKSVAYDQPFMLDSGEDFLLDGLVEIEELTDYTFQPASSAKNTSKKTKEGETEVTGNISKRKLKAEKRKEERKAKRQKKKAEPEEDEAQPDRPEETAEYTKAIKDNGEKEQEEMEEDESCTGDPQREDETQGIQNSVALISCAS